MYCSKSIVNFMFIDVTENLLTLLFLKSSTAERKRSINVVRLSYKLMIFSLRTDACCRAKSCGS